MDAGSFTNTATADSDQTDPIEEEATVEAGADQPTPELIPVPAMHPVGYIMLALFLMVFRGVALRRYRLN